MNTAIPSSVCRLLLTGLLSALLMSGCATPVKGLYHHEGFTHGALSNGGLGIAGIVNAVDSHALWSEVDRSRYAGTLYRAIRDERPALALAPHSDLVNAIGLPSWLALLDSYRASASVSPADHDLISAHYHQARYLLLARLERNEVTRDYQSEEKALTRYSEKLKKEVETGEIEQTDTWSTSRLLSASLQVLDLHAGGQLVWSGTVIKSSTNSNDKSRVFDQHHRIEAAVIDAVVDSVANAGESVPLYPEPPPFEPLLERLITGFAENLPQP